ncbi:MAG: hypothetical protein QM765_48255 [Myxococcales bacterium]
MDAEARQEQLGQPAQPVGGHDDAGLEPLGRRSAQPDQTVKRDRRLAAAGLAQDERRLSGRRLDRAGLRLVEREVDRGSLPLALAAGAWPQPGAAGRAGGG